MLNEKRVRLMTKMAMYETKEGHEDFKISAYYQKDYASLNTWITGIWVTIGYLLVVGFIMLVYIDAILENVKLSALLILAAMIVAGYIITLTISTSLAHDFYQKKHIAARKRVKRFNHDLICLSKMYEKETK